MIIIDSRCQACGERTPGDFLCDSCYASTPEARWELAEAMYQDDLDRMARDYHDFAESRYVDPAEQVW